ncbi:DUF317 domain-containing protein [Streptomyces anulatus]|uniref:DUF317 domain-containing protein n=1 Tax=Streptomyces anulatus TaxID=1892 RepID=UPI003430352E
MTVAPVSPFGFATTAEALRRHVWSLGPGQPCDVMDLFSAENFHFVVDDRADVHVASKDGRFYLGWYPKGRRGSPREGWKLVVTGMGEDAPGYQASFDRETPADIVAAAVARVLETARPADASNAWEYSARP